MDWAAKELASATGKDVDVEQFKIVAIFCGTGLLLSLAAVITFGLEFGAALF